MDIRFTGCYTSSDALPNSLVYHGSLDTPCPFFPDNGLNTFFVDIRTGPTVIFLVVTVRSSLEGHLGHIHIGMFHALGDHHNDCYWALYSRLDTGTMIVKFVKDGKDQQTSAKHIFLSLVHIRNDDLCG